MLCAAMTSLTPQLFDNYPFSHFADPQSIARGREYHRNGNIWHVELIGANKAVCSVEGNSGEYEVVIEVDKKGILTSSAVVLTRTMETSASTPTHASLQQRARANRLDASNPDG